MSSTGHKSQSAAAVRFGVSMENELLDEFDRQIAAAGYTCRSEALRDLARHWLAGRKLQTGRSGAVGVLSFVYDHHRHDLSQRLTGLQHEHHTEIVTTIHVHLDARTCFEVLILRGRADRIRAIADRLTAVKSVEQGRLTIIPVGRARKEK
uniref:Putative nickel-responsive regulator n=1 Tax=candidate division WOR-3 bacterium TaxID=2052148 RepID=A0A7C4GFW7_UNCW3